MSAEAWKKVTVGIAADAASVTDKPTDAVAQARERVLGLMPHLLDFIEPAEREVDALIAAVRAECAAKVREAWLDGARFAVERSEATMAPQRIRVKGGRPTYLGQPLESYAPEAP